MKVSVGVLCLSASLVGLPCVAQKSSAGPETRAKALVARMTLDEKIAQLHGICNEHQFRIVPGVPRLGIPPLRITNGPAGVAHGGVEPPQRATAFPAPIALAASWDVDLARLYGKLAGEETRELGYDLLESPDINIIRVPQNGRTFESLSEDPFLVARLSVASIEGTQSTGALANVKHYLANNQESGRRAINEVIGERELREILMPGFEASIHEGNVASLMCAYPKVNGAFNCENGPLLTDVLKKEWGYKGFVISDYGAVHSTVPSALHGLDLEMPVAEFYGDALKKAVEQGEVPMAQIDDMLVRRYSQMMRFGLFAVRAKPGPMPVLEHGKAAREIAEQSIVLLKNANGLLPLQGLKLTTVALIGPYARGAKDGGGGSSHVIPFYSIEPGNGIAAHMQSHMHLDVLDGSDIPAAVAEAKKADVVIVMVGDDEAEGHDHPIELPAAQNKMIEQVAAANAKTIVVLKSGSAMTMPWINSVAAVLEAWYPGEEDGNAVAAVLFGDVNPSGKLPLTFPKNVEDTLARDAASYPGDGTTVHYSEGIEVGYRWYQAHQVEPLFPFGFGLSYTTFAYSGLKVTPGPAGSHRAEAHFRVTNTGKRAGAEVAQVYLGFPPIAEGNEPPKQLKGFRKIQLSPGESREVTVPLDARAFSYWSVQSHGWKIEPGDYTVFAGSSSEDLPLSASVAMR